MYHVYNCSCSTAVRSKSTSASAAVPSGLLVMRSYYFEEKPEEEPPREVAKQSKHLGRYLDEKIVF